MYPHSAQCSIFTPLNPQIPPEHSHYYYLHITNIAMKIPTTNCCLVFWSPRTYCCNLPSTSIGSGLPFRPFEPLIELNFIGVAPIKKISKYTDLGVDLLCFVAGFIQPDFILSLN